MGQMLVPALIGAGVGAVGSAAMGKSPFTGALMGGAMGGLGGAGGLFGGAAGSAGGSAGGLVGSTGEIGSGLLSTAGGLGGGSVALPAATSSALSSPSILAGTDSTLTGAGMMNQAQLTPSLLNSVGAGGAMTNAGAIPLTTMDKFGNYVSNIPSNAMDYVKNNPVSASKMALDIATPTPQPTQTAPVMPIQRGNFDPSSAIPATPTMGLSKDELAKAKAGQYANMAHLSDQDRRKIGDFYTSLIG
jgi:hypothetical protein